MVVGIGRALAAIVVMLILLVDVQPTMGAVPSLLSPISSVGKMLATTTTKVVKTSVATLNMAAAAPRNVLSKVVKKSK